MSVEKKLDKILDNTEAVKKIVVEKETKKQEQLDEKKKKRSEQLKEAQEKFVKIGASVKPEYKEKIKQKAQDGNIQAYLMKLIDNDLSTTPSLFADAPDEQSVLEITTLKEENKKLKTELEKFKSMNFAQKLKWLFS